MVGLSRVLSHGLAPTEVCSLETHLHAELDVARRIGAARLPKNRVVQANVVADKKVGVVEDVESFGAELETNSVGDPEILE
jgi:hypothetical protein